MRKLSTEEKGVIVFEAIYLIVVIIESMVIVPFFQSIHLDSALMCLAIFLVTIAIGVIIALFAGITATRFTLRLINSKPNS